MIRKEEIEKAKEKCNSIIEFCKNNKECQENKICSDCYIEIEDISAIRTLLQYIEQLEQENNKQNKMINEMANCLVGFTFSNKEELEAIFCNKEEVKQYFEKKVEEN